MIIIILNLQSYVDHQECVGVGVGDGEDDRNLDQSCFQQKTKDDNASSRDSKSGERGEHACAILLPLLC